MKRLENKQGIPQLRCVFNLRRFVLLSLVAGCLGLIGGCASMSRLDCLTVDWFDKGYEDGLRGSTMERYGRYADDCTKHGIAPNRQEYERGRNQGLSLYCTSNKGYRVGRAGRTYTHVCPPGSEPDFLHGFYAGQQVHLAEVRILEVESAIASLKRVNTNLESQVDKLEAELLDDETDDETKATLLRQIKRRQQEIGQNEARIEQYYEKKVDAVVNYRETVEEVRSLGFQESMAY